MIQFPPKQLGGGGDFERPGRHGDGYLFYPDAERGPLLYVGRWTRAAEELVRTARIAHVVISPAWTLPTLDVLRPFAEQLETIAVNSTALKDLGALSSFPRLELLEVRAVVERVPFAELSALRECVISESASLGTLSQAPGLVELSIVGATTGLRDLRDLSRMTTLRNLTLTDISGALRLDGIESLPLTDVWLRALPKLVSVAPLAGLPLRALYVDGARRAEELPRIGDVATMESLHLQDVGSMPSLEFVHGMVAMERLWLAVEYTDANVSLAPVAGLPRLRELSLYNGQRPNLTLSGFELLGRAALLERLDISGGPQKIASIGWVATLPALRAFTMSHLRIADGDLSPLLALPRLEKVVLSPVDKGYSHTPEEFEAAMSVAVAARTPAPAAPQPREPRSEPVPAPPEFPLYHATSYRGPKGYDGANVRAMMNASMDATWLHVTGSVDDLRAHMIHHGATDLHLNVDDLAMLLPCADLIRTLTLDSRFAPATEFAALSSLVNLRTLHDPPPAADALLPMLPRLRRLFLRGSHDLAPLAACAALRELRLIDVPAADLQRMPALPHVELLHTNTDPCGVGMLQRLPALRTLIASAIALDEAEDRALVLERFDADGATLARQRERPSRLEGSWYSAGMLRLDADQPRAERAMAEVDPEAADAAVVSAAQPACIVLLVDHSRSTAQQFRYDFRVAVEVHEPDRNMMERGYGPDGEWTIAEGIARAVNGFLRGLVQRCAGPIALAVHVALIEYGARVGPAWEGSLADRALVSVAELGAAPLRHGELGDEWITAQYGGDTPFGEAMEQAATLVTEWAEANRDAHPPVVIALDAGKHTGDDIGRHAWKIRAAGTRSGNGLLFGIEREASVGFPYFGVEGNGQSEREPLFHFASPLPPGIESAVREAGYVFGGPPRGWFQGASAADFENLLHLYTALPGLASPQPFVAHPVPPAPPPEWAVEQHTWQPVAAKRTPTPRAPWKTPKVKGPMTEALFWRIMDKARTGAADLEEHGARFAPMLEQLDGDDLVEFDRLLRVRLSESNRWELWAVAFIAKGGCSDDGFEYFRAWLIAQGRAYYEATLASPAHAARRIAPGDDAELELLLSAAVSAYEASTKRDDWEERAVDVFQGMPSGDPWEEEDLPALFPKLVKKYG